MISRLRRDKWWYPGGASGKESTCQCRRPKRCRFDPWVRKIPWRRAWQPTLVFLPGESHGQRSLEGYSPYSCKESDMTDLAHTYIHHSLDRERAGLSGELDLGCVEYALCIKIQVLTLSEEGFGQKQKLWKCITYKWQMKPRG